MTTTQGTITTAVTPTTIPVIRMELMGIAPRATATPVIAVAPITTADTTADTTVATGHVAATATATTPLPCGFSGTCSVADHRFHFKPQPINSIMKYQNHRITSLAAALCLPAIALTSAIATAEDKATKKTEVAADKEEATDQRIISLVLLQKSARKLTHGQIAHAVEEGAGRKVAEDQVVTKEGYHFVPIGDDKYIVTDIDEPYFAEAAKLADELEDHHLSDAVKSATAWLSVDWPNTDDRKDLKHVYQHIGKTIAHLSNKETLAVYSPDLDAFALWTPAVRETLEGDDPLAVFEKPAAKE